MKMESYTAIKNIFYFRSDVGVLKITTKNERVLSVTFMKDDNGPYPISDSNSLTAFQIKIKRLLTGYFVNKKRELELSLSLEGTSFEKKVWNYILKIPYGQTTTYGEIAQKMGDSKKVRAIGHAVGKNPIAIIVLCHRVIGSNGDLTGYAGGLWRKEWLLKHEGALLI